MRLHAPLQSLRVLGEMCWTRHISPLGVMVTAGPHGALTWSFKCRSAQGGRPVSYACVLGPGKCLGTRDGLVLDAPPLRMHYPKLILAALFQIPYIVLMVALGLPISALTPCEP